MNDDSVLLIVGTIIFLFWLVDLVLACGFFENWEADLQEACNQEKEDE